MKKKINFENNSHKLDYNKLKNFLDQNIYNIEKSLNSFIKDIYIILGHDEFLPVRISIKKDNNGNLVSMNDLIYSLNELKNYCKKTLEKKKIIHMLIDDYILDGKNYSNLDPNINCDNFSLDVRFICLPSNIIENLEKILKKYQIAITQIVEVNYINDFFRGNSKDIFFNAREIILGRNINEVKLLEKRLKNKGFFEKFFNFFS